MTFVDFVDPVPPATETSAIGLTHSGQMDWEIM